MLAFCFCVEACTSGSSLLVEFFFYFSFNLQKKSLFFFQCRCLQFSGEDEVIIRLRYPLLNWYLQPKALSVVF